MASEVLITLKPPLRPHKARSSVGRVRDMCVLPVGCYGCDFWGNERFLEPGIWKCTVRSDFLEVQKSSTITVGRLCCCCFFPVVFFGAQKWKMGRFSWPTPWGGTFGHRNDSGAKSCGCWVGVGVIESLNLFKTNQKKGCRDTNMSRLFFPPFLFGVMCDRSLEGIKYIFIYTYIYIYLSYIYNIWLGLLFYFLGMGDLHCLKLRWQWNMDEHGCFEDVVGDGVDATSAFRSKQAIDRSTATGWAVFWHGFPTSIATVCHENKLTKWRINCCSSKRRTSRILAIRCSCGLWPLPWTIVWRCRSKSGATADFPDYAVVTENIGGGNSNIFYFHLYLGKWSIWGRPSKIPKDQGNFLFGWICLVGDFLRIVTLW